MEYFWQYDLKYSKTSNPQQKVLPSIKSQESPYYLAKFGTKALPKKIFLFFWMLGSMGAKLLEFREFGSQTTQGNKVFINSSVIVKF